MLDPIRKTIEVPCNREKAFNVFVNEVNNWWPLDKNTVSAMGGEVAKRVVIEPNQDGKVYEIGHDDTEHHWGTFKTYDPHDSISMDFHMGLPPESASLVEVWFTALGDDRTRVELTQSNWEGFGDMAETMRSGYGSSWGLIFEEAYKEACGG